MALSSFEEFITSLDIQPLIDTKVSNNAYVSLDLSVYNKELDDIDVSSSTALEGYIWNHLKIHNAKVAFGGYLEHRGIYNRSAYFNTTKPEEVRNIHLGLDLWIEANTAIYTPLSGTVHSFKNNTNYGDYGPTIILRHNIKGETFYTLYGHLSLESISNLKVGAELKQGDKIATLGTAEVNGDYAPHLHFQIIKDIQDYYGDYPGVSNQQDLEFYKTNCPDPNFLLKLI
ncbi:peptidoglycan DD-metalloendopeptidase family protein [Winogradskyella aquimaris]|uniref:Peptidoglycan DD-metalloendopeptidase family protein n=1 Tax=Winogradskyella aquimaris TaxID=864074 RepID=A0ABU5EQY6_9FLAO|nr:peptidoglycan DD-metalloendopeptidase family protein [Winogradskyella aquimaris]MDY2587189.1 peptidoglycan DD-metalloendopeptidase family protein [Winogradskyella aquimaris]